MNEITCCKCARLEEVIKEACPYGFTFSPTLLLDRHSVLPVYYILRKIPAYPFIRA